MWKLAAATLTLLALGGCRLDMHVQPRVDTLDENPFYSDHMAARPVVPDTIARGQLRTNELLYTGKINGEVADAFPFPITKADMERGRDRYRIYCSPCHGLGGNGQGMVVQRGMEGVASYHVEKLQKAPAGHFYDVISNGLGRMYSYSSRINVEDRWRIVAYIRALQLSQSAKIEDVPEAARRQLQESAQ